MVAVNSPVSNSAAPASQLALASCALSLETSAVKAIAIIPARLASTRLPRKVLREIDGRPMLAYVYEAARACSQLQDVIVATDSEEIAAVCRQNGWSLPPDLAAASQRHRPRPRSRAGDRG